jgi:hypothetical protein
VMHVVGTVRADDVDELVCVDLCVHCAPDCSAGGPSGDLRHSAGVALSFPDGRKSNVRVLNSDSVC